MSAADAATRMSNLPGIVADALGMKIEPNVSGEYRVGDTRHSVSDITKLQRLGWRPTRAPRDSVRDYIEWIRRQKLEKDYAAECSPNSAKWGR